MQNNKEQNLLDNLIDNNNTATIFFIYCIFLNLDNNLESILKKDLYLLIICICL